jgi:hypothetical protein
VGVRPWPERLPLAVLEQALEQALEQILEQALAPAMLLLLPL